MELAAQLYDLLAEKKSKFLQYEQLTQDMLHCSTDDLGDYITKRGNLANEIDLLSERMQELYQPQKNAELYAKICFAQADFADVPKAMHPLFTLGQEVRAVLARTQKMEPAIMQRLETLKTEAFQKIKENRNMPKIKKYLSNLGEQPGSGHFTSTKI